MAQEEPYDRWHLSDPPPDAPECPDHPGLVPSKDHGRGMRYLSRWRENGKQQSKSFPDGRKTAAAKHQRSMKAAVEEGRTPAPGRRRRKDTPTVEEYVETFISRSERRPGTVDNYKSRLRCHVVPALGDRPVSQLTRGEIKDFLASLKGMPGTSRTGVKKALSAMLTAAVEDDELLPGNPVVGIKIPNDRARETAQLTWAHVVALAEEIDPRYELLVWYGALQGLRAMEAAGVREQDMLCDKGLQFVEEQRQRGEAVELKTKSSRAFVPLGTFLIDKYEAHMVRWRSPLSATALRKRERRGLSPILEEYTHLVTVNRYWNPVARNALPGVQRSEEEGSEARRHGAEDGDVPGPAALLRCRSGRIRRGAA